VQHLHEQAEEMNDPHAKRVLDSAAFSMGNMFRRKRLSGDSQETPPEAPE